MIELAGPPDIIYITSISQLVIRLKGMINYEKWNKAIIKHIFENSDPGDIVFLNTTPETLNDIAMREGFNTGDAVESLKEAVRDKVVKWGIVRLLKISPNDLYENTPEEEPSQVAFLALTVLAASRMKTLKYYKSLNELLFDDPDRGRWETDELEHIEKLWKHLQNCVEYQYNIELHLTPGPSNQRFVWYPKSQCLISKRDEYKLHAIFFEAKLKPGAYLAEKQLFDVVRSSKYFQNISVKIKRPIQEQNTAEIRLILGRIQLILESWNGKVQESTSSGIGKRRKTHIIDVQLKFNAFRSEDIDQIRYWFRCRQKPQINFKPNSLNVESLQSDNDKWFEPFVVNADFSSLQVLQKGIEIKSEEMKSLTYQLKPSDIWVFRNESEPDDGWFSQGNLLLHELHRIVFRREKSHVVTSFLKDYCDPLSSPKSLCVGGEETSWQYVDVKPIVLCKNTILGYSITTSKQISFVGGLPLDRRKNQYFDFCLPTIVVPDHYTQADAPFQFNSKSLHVPSNRKIELTEKLDQGEYLLSYLDSQIILRVISPARSCDYVKQTFAIDIDIKSKNPPSFKVFKMSEMSEESGVWLSGAKFFGEDNILLSIERNEDTLAFSAAELISSVVKVAMELKQENVDPPEWIYKAINYLNQDIALQALVKKKLYDYREIALSYTELCKQIGK